MGARKATKVGVTKSGFKKGTSSTNPDRNVDDVSHSSCFNKCLLTVCIVGEY